MFSRLKYKLRKKKYGVHFGNDNIIANGFVLNPVHILPENKWKPNQEADFYMDDNSDIYFLRLINSNEYKITLIDSNELRFIIIRIPIENIYSQIENILNELKKFPYCQKINGTEKSYDFMKQIKKCT